MKKTPAVSLKEAVKKISVLFSEHGVELNRFDRPAILAAVRRYWKTMQEERSNGLIRAIIGLPLAAHRGGVTKPCVTRVAK